MDKNLISIIIPAHNEEKVITRCLKNLLNKIDLAKVEIIVVCNGCTDQTASIVRSNYKQVKLIELSVPSKIKALNAGDDLASGFPRVYLDADVVINGAAIMKLAEEMESKLLLAASPVVKIELEGRPWVVKQFYKVWRQLPYVLNGTVGSGVYALSKKGREKFDKFPEIIADDGFIRSLFTSDERGVISNTFFTVFPPMSIIDLIKIKIRVRAGIYELKKLYPDLVNKKDFNNKSINYIYLLKDISLWPGFLIYFIINTCTITGGMYKYWFGNKYYWTRDNSSRL